MPVTVEYYSRLRDATGLAEETWECPEGETLGTLLARVFARHPALTEWDTHLLLAVNDEYATRDQALAAGDVISVMPPVQGG